MKSITPASIILRIELAFDRMDGAGEGVSFLVWIFVFIPVLRFVVIWMFVPGIIGVAILVLVLLGGVEVGGDGGDAPGMDG